VLRRSDKLGALVYEAPVGIQDLADAIWRRQSGILDLKGRSTWRWPVEQCGGRGPATLAFATADLLPRKRCYRRFGTWHSKFGTWHTNLPPIWHYTGLCYRRFGT
jgi:hypothetical protein